MNTLLILSAVVALTLAGDWCIKVASGDARGMLHPIFLTGLVLYALPAVGWLFLMRSHSLAAIGVYYSAALLILLAAVGHLAFREPFGLREAIGVSLAVASVVVMSHEA